MFTTPDSMRHLARISIRYAVLGVLLVAPRLTGAQPTIRQIDGAPFAATIVAAESGFVAVQAISTAEPRPTPSPSC